MTESEKRDLLDRASTVVGALSSALIQATVRDGERIVVMPEAKAFECRKRVIELMEVVDKTPIQAGPKE